MNESKGSRSGGVNSSQIFKLMKKQLRSYSRSFAAKKKIINRKRDRDTGKDQKKIRRKKLSHSAFIFTFMIINIYQYYINRKPRIQYRRLSEGTAQSCALLSSPRVS